MTTENNSTSSDPAVTAPVEVVKKDYTRSVKDVVTDKLKEANPTILGLIADDLVSAEVLKRKDVLKKVLTETLPKQKGELARLKSTDTGLFNADGSKIVKSSWTAEELKTIKEATEKFDKLNTAVTNAIENGNWEKLLELGK